MTATLALHRAIVGWTPVAPIEMAEIGEYALLIDEDGQIAWEDEETILALDAELVAAFKDAAVPAEDVAMMGWFGDLRLVVDLIEEAREILLGSERCPLPASRGMVA